MLTTTKIRLLIGLSFIIYSCAKADAIKYINDYEGDSLAVVIVDMQEPQNMMAGTKMIHEHQRKIIEAAFHRSKFIVCVLLDTSHKNGRWTTLQCPNSIIKKEIKESELYIEHIKPLSEDFYKGSEEIFPKSAFEDGSLHIKLQKSGVSHLIIMGAYTGICIQETVRDALTLNYHVILEPFSITHTTPSQLLLNGYDSRKETLMFWAMIKNVAPYFSGKNPQVICTPHRNATLTVGAKQDFSTPLYHVAK